MSLISTPNGDGTRTIQVDFPYYIPTPSGRRPKGAKHWQKHTEDEAREAAEKHVAFVNRVFPQRLSVRIEHRKDRQSFYVIEIASAYGVEK